MTNNVDDEAQTSIRVGAYGLCIRDDQILLILLAADDQEAGLWTLPGGGIDWGEDPTIALTREFWEETGLTVQAGGLLGVDSKVYDRETYPHWTPLHVIRLIYEAVAQGEPKVMEVGGSTAAVAWWPVGGMPATTDLVEIALDKLRTRRP